MSWITADSIRSKILTPQVLERRGFGDDGTPLAGNDKTFGNRISALAKQNTAAAERQASEDTKNVRRRAITIRESSNDKGAIWIKMSPTDPRRTETVNIGTELTDFDTQYPNIFEFLTTGDSDSLKTNYIITKGTGGTGPSGLQWINTINDQNESVAKEGTSFSNPTSDLNDDTYIQLQADILAKREAIINNNPTADLSTHEFDFTAEEWAKYQIQNLTYDHYVEVTRNGITYKYQPLQPKATKAHSIKRYHIVDGDVDDDYNQNTNIGTEYVLVGDDTVGDPTIIKDLDKDIDVFSGLNYGDWFSYGDFVWVLSRSTEDERQYQREIEKDVRELRRRCIRIREKKTDGTKIGQIWIKMKKYDPRRTDTVNIGIEVSPDTPVIQVLTNNTAAFVSTHNYYGKYFVVDSKIDSEHNYVDRDSPTGFEYVFDEGSVPTIANLKYGDYYDPDSDNSEGYVWVVSRSTEDERQYQRDNEKKVRELRRRCIRIREKKTDDNKIGQIWIKMKKYDPRRTDTVNIGDVVTPHTKITEVLQDDANVFDATSDHPYYGKFFVVDSDIDSEHNYVVRNNPTGTEYVFDNDFNLLGTIGQITVTGGGTGYTAGQNVGLVITREDGISPIIYAVATVTADETGAITNSSVVIEEKGLGYSGNITVKSSQDAEFSVTVGAAGTEDEGKITEISVTKQGIGYAEGELTLTITDSDSDNTPTVAAVAKVTVPSTGIIDVGSSNDVGSNITINSAGEGYTADVTAALAPGVNPGSAATFAVTLNDIYNYGDYYDPNSSDSEGFVWVVSRSTEDERQYQRDNEKNVRELRRRCIRIREKSSTVGQIWIKMKKYDPRRTITVNIGDEVAPDDDTKNVLENDPNVFDVTSGHTYYGKFFVVDSKIDSEHNYVDRDSPTGFEYVFDEGSVPTIANLKYGDYYDPDLSDSDGYVWVVSRSTENEREYQRVIEKEVKELRRSCIRHRENSTTIGQIWVKEPDDAVKIQGYKYVNKTLTLNAKLKEVFANKSSVFTLGHDYYRQFFVVDSHIDSEHDYVVRNSPSGITYVFNDMTMAELSTLNTTLDYGNYVKLGNSISAITVIDVGSNYSEGQTISLVIKSPDNITPIITALATITVPVGGTIDANTQVYIEEEGVGYGGNTTVISSQVAQFLVTVGAQGDENAGKIIDIIVITQGVGYKSGELTITINDSDTNSGTGTGGEAKLVVPETGIIDIGSNITITNEGANYVDGQTTVSLSATPGDPLNFTVTETPRTDRFVVSRSTEVMREYMKSIEVSREAAREMYRLQEGISLLNNLEAWDPENRIGRIWIYVSDDTFPSLDKEIEDYDYPGFPNSLMYGVPSGYSWYKYDGSAPITGAAVLFNNATVTNGEINEIVISQEGSGYTPGEIIDLTITDTGGIDAAATVPVAADGSISTVTAITVTNIGSGYSQNVSVSLAKPEPFNGTEVSFNVSVTNGEITQITINEPGGTGYTNFADSDATLVITDNGGSGASAKVTVNFDGTISAVQKTNNGSGYSANVTVSCKTNNTQLLLEKSELASALALRQDFTPSEWNSFSISGLTVNHYVEVVEDGVTNYYKPVPGKLIYTSEELDQYGLNTIDSTNWVRNTATTAPRNSGYFIPSYHINQNYKNLQYPSNVLNNILGRVWLKVDKEPTDGSRYDSSSLQEELDAGTLSFTLDRLDELGIVSAYSSGLNWKQVETLPSSGIVFINSGLTSKLDGTEASGTVKTITKSEWDDLAIDIGLTENHYIIGSGAASTKYYKPVNKNNITSSDYIESANTGYYYVPGYWVNSTFKDAYYPLVDPAQ